MKILKVVHILYAGLGGHGAVLFTLLEHKFLDLAEHVVVFVGVEEPRAEYLTRCNELNISWIYVPRSSTKSYARFVFTLLKTLLSLDPNMVFAHGLAATPSLVLLRFFSWKRRFIVMRETQAHHLKSFREWIFLLIANSSFDRIVCLTKEAQIGSKAKLGFFHKEKKSVVIGNGLDTGYFSPDVRRTGSAYVKIGMQSRLQANKDHRTLIDAFHILHSTNTALDMSLHIAGDGDTLPILKSYVAELGLGDRIIFYGMLGQEELRKFLSDLSIYAHCTHGETMSTAIMQALSMGLPVIASDVWGVSNMIKNGNGLLYRPGDAVDLANKLNQIIVDEDLANRLGVLARQQALNNYSNKKLVEKYNEVFCWQRYE